MKIAILTLGSLGDVLPFALLGKALRRAGHEVVFVSGANFESLAQEHQLPFVPVEADFRQMAHSEEGKRMMKTPLQTRRNLRTHIYPMIRNALRTFYAEAAAAGKVIFHSKTLADCFADRFPEKMIRSNVVPAFEPTSAFPNPVGSGFPLPGFANKLSFRFSNLIYRLMGEPMRALRKEIGLPAAWQFQSLPSIYGISEHFLPKPADYGPHSYFTGFWREASAAELPPDLKYFLENGPPPLLLTFGSMPFQSKLDLNATLQTLTQQLDIRMLVAKGWGLGEVQLEETPLIKQMPYIPYDAVLPYTKAVIHHGGIGTISSCLYAGKPFLSCPVIYPWGDQYFWGMIAHQRQVALRPAPLKKLTTEKLVRLTRQLLHTPSLYEHARELQLKLRNENGLDNAVRIIESLA